jgi:malonate transporter and related proteins
VLSILTVTSPFFLLVLAGYLAARSMILPITAISGLNAFVLYFALPCMLFRFGSNTPIAQLLDLTLAGLYLLVALIIIGLGVLISKKSHLDWNNTAFGALVGTFPNTGFMGVPLLVALLGEAAAGPVIVTIFVDLVIVSSLCIALSRITPDAQQSFATAIGRTLKGVVSNPMPWAICLGAVASALQVQPPEILHTTIALLANAASPVALFTIGALLARSAVLAKTGYSSPVLHGAVNSIVVIKLVLHPVLLYSAMALANHLGAGIDPFTMLVVTLVGALPSASNVTLLAERFAADSARIAKIILISTSLAFFSFPAVVALLK